MMMMIDDDDDDDLIWFQSERFLALFKQFQELGFSDHRIKDELVKNDLDSDKTLDSLTAWVHAPLNPEIKCPLFQAL